MSNLDTKIFSDVRLRVDVHIDFQDNFKNVILTYIDLIEFQKIGFDYENCYGKKLVVYSSILQKINFIPWA